MGFVVFDARNCNALFGPVKLGEGGDPDEFISISFNDDDFVAVEGVDGSVTRCRKPNSIITIEHKLMSSSSVNQALSAIRIADRVSKNGAGVTTFLYKDLGGSSLVASSKCWIKKPADIKAGSEIKMVTWTFEAVVDDAAFIVGGN